MRRLLPGRPDAPRPAGTVQIGAWAEETARAFLESQGLSVVASNYRCRAGELDLVMLDGAELVIAEVRYRTSGSLVHPALTISATKRRRLLLAADRFLQAHRQFADHPVRFDIVAMTGPIGAAKCEWLRCAFTAEDAGGFR